MTEIGFYHLTTSSLSEGAFKLLQKAQANGLKVVLRARSDACIEYLNQALWTLDAASFLPHGSHQEPHAERQPILLTTAIENPNQADVLMLVEDAELEENPNYSRIFYLFEDHDDERKNAARQRWKAWKDQYQAVYWQQTEQGGWQKKA